MSSQGGKGGKQTSVSQTMADSQTNIPTWLTDTTHDAVDRAAALSRTPYQAYQGERVAPQAIDTYQAYQQVRDLQGAGQPAFDQSLNAYGNLVGQAQPLTAGALNDNTNSLFGNFEGNVYNPAAANLGGAYNQSQGLLGGYLGGGPATAEQVAGNAQTLMSPYAQNVIAPTIAAGQQQLALAKQGIASQANNVGAFGGSRMGVQEGVADAAVAANTQQQVAQLMNQGWGQALTPAYGLATQGAQQGLTAASTLAQQGYGNAQNLNSLLGQGYGNAASAGQNLANTNLQAGITAAGALPNVATANQAYSLKDAGALQASGGAQTAYQQQIDNANLGSFYEKQNDPYQKLNYLLGATGAIPYDTSSQNHGWGNTTNQAFPGIMDQISGAIGLVGKVASTAGAVAA